MKILWLVNIIMPELAEHLNITPSVFGGWLTGAMNLLRAKGVKQIICTTGEKNRGRYEVNGVVYYITASDRNTMSRILREEQPDVVHIFGTEFPHSMAMFQAADRAKTVVTIQGALSYLKDNVYAGLPERKCRDNLIHKALRLLHKGGQSIDLQKQRFDTVAVLEKYILEQAKYIHGGSKWGTAVAYSVNQKAKLFDFGLILRDSFYCNEIWSYEACEKHSILILHSYPIKGFHKFLEALKIVVKKYPDTRVSVVANTVTYRRYGKLKTAIMNVAPDYNWLIQKYIEENDLQKYIFSLGSLSEGQMKERMLLSNVFVSASAIENQSTTLGEAMILGVPSVASFVGAIPEMIDDGTDGFLYPFHEPYILADKIIRIFDDRKLAEQFSVNGHTHAARTYSREKNGSAMLEMYKTICENSDEEK